MKWIPTAIAIAVGLIVLLDFFFILPVLDALGIAFREWTIILTAFALLVGIFNLLLVHFTRVIRRNEAGAEYSIVLLVTSAIVIVIGFPFPLSEGPMAWLFEYIYVPLQSAFFALTVFFLATGAYRALRVKSFETLLMLVAALVVFVGQLPLFNVLVDVREWVLNVPSEAGVRGILLGVALGTIATGLRLMVGLDRPYSE